MTTSISTLRRKSRQPMTVDPQNPRAMGVCDGCGFWVPHHTMVKRMQYRGGTTPVWDGMLVCQVCDDVPNPAPQFSRLTLFPDPVPVDEPRPEAQTNSAFGYWVDNSGNFVNLVSDVDAWGGEFVQTVSDWQMTQNGFSG